MSHFWSLSDRSFATAGAALVKFAIAGVAYAYIGYPLLLWLISRLIPRRPSVPVTDVGLTLIIAAHNEEAAIREKLEATLRLDYPHDKLQVLVASDGSTDKTNEIVREFRDRGVE